MRNKFINYFIGFMCDIIFGASCPLINLSPASIGITTVLAEQSSLLFASSAFEVPAIDH